MRKKASSSPAEKRKSGSRISVTIPARDYHVVQVMAKTKKVSVAWIIRDAVEKYIHSNAVT